MKYLIILFSIIACKSVSLKKNIGYKDSIFRYSNDRKSFIEYPRDPIFTKNSFNLKSLSIYEFDSYYTFAIEIDENFKNDWHLPGGWDIQLFDIYINLGKGKHFQCLKGRKTKIKEGWDKVVVVSPLKISDIKSEISQKNSYIYDNFSEIESLVKDTIPAQEKSIEKNYIYIKVSKESLDNLNIKSIQVLLMGLDPNGKESSVREVKQFATRTEFGGGSSIGNNPNVIDLLGDINQLKNYESEGARVSFADIKLIPIEKIEKLNENK